MTDRPGVIPQACCKTKKEIDKILALEAEGLVEYRWLAVIGPRIHNKTSRALRSFYPNQQGEV